MTVDTTQYHSGTHSMHANYGGGSYNRLAGTYVSMVLGAERFEGGAAGDVWIDDVAVNSAQIGCT